VQEKQALLSGIVSEIHVYITMWFGRGVKGFHFINFSSSQLYHGNTTNSHHNFAIKMLYRTASSCFSNFSIADRYCAALITCHSCGNA